MDQEYLALKIVMMPRDTNPQGTIFGGVILSHIDAAGAIGARMEIRKRGGDVPGIVTVAMHQVEFHQPVFVGDVVSFRTRPIRFGRTSVTMHVSVEVDRDGQTVQVTEAEVIYVVVDRREGGYRPHPYMPEQG